MKAKIREIAKVINGSTPSTKCPEYYDGDILWITPKDLSDQGGKYIYKGERTITQAGYNSCSTEIIPKNNILMSSRAPIGLLAINKVDCCTNQGFKNLVIDKSKCHEEFLYYYLKYHIKEIEALGSGTTFKEVSKKSIEEYEIELPSLDVQKKIIKVLKNLDEKIITNNKINAELEAMAKTIYDYWFLQFEFPNEEGKPYKSSGGKMVWNEELKREIPEGWEVVEFQNLCNIRRGASPRPINEYMDETGDGMPWVKISDATCNESPFMTQIKECIVMNGISKSVRVKPDTLIVSNSATPGIPKFIQIDACVHDGWLVLDNYEEYYKYYLFYVIKMVRNNLLNVASGSIFKNLKTDYLKEYKCINPNTDLLIKFNDIIKQIMQKILKTQIESEELTSLRDYLLPLLMNGQVGFKEVGLAL